MNMSVIPIVVFALGTIPKGLVKELEELEIGERAANIKTIALLRLARVLKRDLEF